MYNYNGFDLLISVVFSMITQLGGLVPKSQDLVIPFHLGKIETLLYYYLRALKIIIELNLMQYQTGQINNLTGKYITEL